MFLGRYDYDGEPAELLAAYDRLMDVIPRDGISIHVCIRRDGGITVYDACPSAEVFAAFSTSDALLGATAAAGLPAPSVTPLGEVHTALASPDHLT